MLYVIYPDMEIWQYMLHDYKTDSNEICIRALNQNCTKWQLAIRKLFNNSTVPSCLLFNSRLSHELNALKNGDSVLLCDYADPVLIKTINTLVPHGVRKYYWIWNPVTDNDRDFYSHAFRVMKSLGFELATFDENDAKQYGMRLYNQFFRREHLNDTVCASNGAELHDFYFVGFAKNREADLLQLQEQLKGYRLFFKIVHNYAEAITYNESVRNILQSKCIVEYVQHNQKGMTLRPLEALFYQKKLITNNQDTVKFDFYRPENIFIIGKDKLESLSQFLEIPFHPISSDIVERYSISTWFNHFKLQ